MSLLVTLFNKRAIDRARIYTSRQFSRNQALFALDVVSCKIKCSTEPKFDRVSIILILCQVIVWLTRELREPGNSDFDKTLDTYRRERGGWTNKFRNFQLLSKNDFSRWNLICGATFSRYISNIKLFEILKNVYTQISRLKHFYLIIVIT